MFSHYVIKFYGPPKYVCSYIHHCQKWMGIHSHKGEYSFWISMYLIGISNKGGQIQLRSFQIMLPFFVSVQDITAHLSLFLPLTADTNTDGCL
jgi:hypothetical protein